ncbi:MAG: hypothetical protein MUE82_02865 [Chloroflexi bacterium]|nr:hypothetical protein [Chloroflexota bacterium]
MSHPALGAMPPDMTAGLPDAAARLLAARARLGEKALRDALAASPQMRARWDETGLRNLLRDTEVMVERIAKAVASGDPIWTREWADWVAPVYRRRRVPMDDAIALMEGLRGACAAMLDEAEREPMNAGIDAAVAVFRYYRRFSGDARVRNPILDAIYKGA